MGLPKVKKNYWEGIQKELFSILTIDLPLTPNVILLEHSLREDGGKMKLYLLHVLLLIAMKMITSSWLKPLRPMTPQWQERVKTTAHLHLKMDKTEQDGRLLVNTYIYQCETLSNCAVRVYL